MDEKNSCVSQGRYDRIGSLTDNTRSCTRSFFTIVTAVEPTNKSGHIFCKYSKKGRLFARCGFRNVQSRLMVGLAMLFSSPNHGRDTNCQYDETGLWEICEMDLGKDVLLSREGKRWRSFKPCHHRSTPVTITYSHTYTQSHGHKSGTRTHTEGSNRNKRPCSIRSGATQRAMLGPRR